ncbi:TIGR02452 family protein [Ruminococcus sp.]|uniref:TIGR02452 family protein n=1 Tax=Ruminococcus sp. TaxID=41978 RepID=UPI002587AB1A|nr:TIGR02452 family protein [Ruminococcus sp.]MCR5019607.1 TIGR02452 family protein [Ruminococcus sp.]
MNYIAIANETIRITDEHKYTAESRTIDLPKNDMSAVEVITPAIGKDMLAMDISEYFTGGSCVTEVTCEDSFQAARRLKEPMVMNFANAHKPGGGFRHGAHAQEESLCRCSTLYRSITSAAATEMYLFNNTHLSRTESDYMLFSPEVWVFRDSDMKLSPTPFRVSVITVPAPNRRGAALIASEKLIEETMTRRIRIMLHTAASHGCRELVLGAWGCGAFGNPPEKVSGYFKNVLKDDGYEKCFTHIVFAVYGKPDGRNITAFKNTFGV